MSGFTMAQPNVTGPTVQFSPSLRVPILDLLLPGFSIFYASVEHLGNLSSYTPLLCVFGAAVFLLGRALRWLQKLVESHFSSSFLPTCEPHF